MVDTPKVTLAGKDYLVPLLVPRQQRVVIPGLFKLTTAIKEVGGRAIFDPEKMTTALYDEMLKIVYWGAIWPNDKRASEGILFDADIGFDELSKAINVIRLQSGLFSKAASEDVTKGESQTVTSA